MRVYVRLRESGVTFLIDTANSPTKKIGNERKLQQVAFVLG